MGNFQRILFSGILKNITSTKIKVVKIKISYYRLTLQHYENITLKCNLSMVVQNFLVLK